MLNSKHSFRFISRKKIPTLKDENVVLSVAEPAPVDTKKEKKNVDVNRRMFLKIAGMTGLGVAASALFPKQANAYVAGSTPTSNVVGVKNATNTRIDPATEATVATLGTEATLGGIKTQSDKLTFDGTQLLTKSVVTVSNIANAPINPATEEGMANVGNSVNDQSIWMLRKIATLLKPLGMTTGSGSNRLSIDVNTGTISISSGTITTVSTVTTVGSMTNLVNIGNINSFSLMKDSARNAYANSIRSKITF